MLFYWLHSCALIPSSEFSKQHNIHTLHILSGSVLMLYEKGEPVITMDYMDTDTAVVCNGKTTPSIKKGNAIAKSKKRYFL